MEDIEKLLTKREYEKVLDFLKDHNDVDSLFYKLFALINLRRNDEALKLIHDEHKKLETKLPKLMRIHIMLLVALFRFDEAYKVLEYYQSLPYFSMEVEESFPKYFDFIKKKEKEAIKGNELSLSKIREDLLSSDSTKALYALDSLKEIGVLPFINEIKRVLVSDKLNENVKTYALLLLVSEGYDKPVNYTKYGEQYFFVPNKLTPPYTSSEYHVFCERLSKDSKNPTLLETEISILNQVIMVMYPREVKLNIDFEAALNSIAHEFLASPLSDEELLKIYKNASKNGLLKEKKTINDALSLNQDLSV